jgi:NTE family protein
VNVPERDRESNTDADRLARELAPTRPLPGEEPGGRPEPGIGLCLSGGGYRAMLFHVGALRRLNEAALLPQLERVSSVSGGSITAGQLALAWPDLAFDRDVAGRFVELVEQPLRRLAGETIDRAAISRGIFTRGTIGEKIVAAYREHLFGDKTLQDLPDEPAPRFVINATNLQSAVLWRFSRPYMRDYRVGSVPNPRVAVATAVAASAAFPPFLSPVVLNLDDAAYAPGSGDDLQRPPYTTEVVLADGGVYDNLGLETVWKRYQTVLVSDGGGHVAAEESPAKDWLRQVPRVLSVIDSQVRALRKRQVIESYRQGWRDGAYWGIRSHIGDYGVPDTLPCEPAATMRLATVGTRLARMEAVVQERLINWGYAVCDAALRAHVDPQLTAPSGFPYPSAAVG